MVTYIISLTIALIAWFVLKHTRLFFYEEENSEPILKFVKRWMVLLFIVCFFVPILNVVVSILVLIMLLALHLFDDIEWSSNNNKILKWLNESI